MSDTTGQDLQTKYALQAQRTEIELKTIGKTINRQAELLEAHVKDDKAQNDRHLEILDRISAQVDDTQKCLDKLNSKVDLSSQKLQGEISKINILDEQQNRMLDEHIAGVNTLKSMHTEQKAETERRLKKLEKPGEWWRMTKKGLLSLAAVAAAVMTLLKLLEVI